VGTFDTRYIARLPPRLTPYRLIRDASTYGRPFTCSITARPSSIAVADAFFEGTFISFQSPPR
jgi:hypothetical protein